MYTLHRLLAVMAILLGVLALAPHPSVAASVTYTEDTSDFANPERGWHEPIDPVYSTNSTGAQLTLNQLQTLRSQNVTLVRKYYVLAPYVGGASIAQSLLDHLQNDLNTCRTAGLKLIPRFTYVWNLSTNSQDASLATTTAHIQQLGTILRANADVVSHVEAGFVGYWAEWHDSSNNHVNNTTLALNSSGSQIISTLLAEMPATRMVLMRYPKQLMQLYPSALTAAQAYDGSAQSRLGMYNDGFFHDDNDFGTFSPDATVREQEKTYLNQTNLYVVQSGEPGGGTYYTTHSPIVDLERMHWTSLSRNQGDSGPLYSAWQADGTYATISKRLGYRFRLTDANIPTSISSGGTLNFSLNLTNDGFAAPHNPRGFELVLRNQATQAVYRVDLAAANDPRRWVPGARTLTISAALAGIPDGSYQLLLNLPDPAATLHDRPEYSIRLANLNVWESATGFNSLLHTLTIGTGGTAPTATPTATPIAGGPFVYWRLDETSGTTASDASGNGLSGTLQGGVSFNSGSVSGVVGTGLKLDGTNDYLSSANVSIGTSNVTVAAYVKTTTKRNQGVIAISDAPGGTRLRMMLTNTGAVTYGLYCNGAWQQRTAGTGVANGSWHHVAVVFNRGGTALLYVDKTLIDGSLSVAACASGNITGPLEVGSDFWTSNSYLKGNLDEVGIYRAALSAAEIAALP